MSDLFVSSKNSRILMVCPVFMFLILLFPSLALWLLTREIQLSQVSVSRSNPSPLPSNSFEARARNLETAHFLLAPPRASPMIFELVMRHLLPSILPGNCKAGLMPTPGPRASARHQDLPARGRRPRHGASR